MVSFNMWQYLGLGLWIRSHRTKRGKERPRAAWPSACSAPRTSAPGEPGAQAPPAHLHPGHGWSSTQGHRGPFPSQGVTERAPHPREAALPEAGQVPRAPARLCYLRPGRERRRAHVCRPPSEPGSPSLCAEEEGTEWLQPRTVKTRSAKGRPLPPPTLKPHESKTSGHLPWEGDSSLQRAPSAQQVDP